MTLNKNSLPSALIPLIPMAERWGIGDDSKRDAMIESASPEDLETLVHCIDSVTDDQLFSWLSGAESFNKNPSNEYIAFTCLTIAIDSAKIRLKSLKSIQ
jgi:hypothetical protein